MTESGSAAERRPVVLRPGEGRSYPMGRISAVFKADGVETGRGYSISEWWLEPYTKGPGAHSHPEDDVFYILAGTVSVLVGAEWLEASPGNTCRASRSGLRSILPGPHASQPRCGFRRHTGARMYVTTA